MGLLKDSDRRTTSVQWPDEVDAHLDLLVRLAAGEGILISRAQMLSALVADANLDKNVVATIARRYLSNLNEGDLARTAPPEQHLPVVRHRGRQRARPA
ncbi:hypothetical protein ACTOB_003644 [Actinoplanes oblitus]|uniref:CopG family transcriptional regulator n=1 Tax=Actinoplanes oblitus TaxID=3040509 RepID=A0ABY8WTL4_9ACTN|nr:hypothetical protein [Actinoplanes oblitus]WIM99973.1 hypothetical protein ACTOB_003644 [Actinoplanes oblitus]